MNSTFKGIISIVLALISLFSAVFFNFFHFQPSLILAIIIPVLLSIISIYISIQVRKSGMKALGIAGLLLGILGILSKLPALFFIVMVLFGAKIH